MKAFQKKQDCGVSTAATNGILKLAFFFAEHQIPLACADHLVPLIGAVCPDSKIASELKGARTKMTAAVKTVGGDMHRDLVEMMSSSFFSLMPDESTDIAIPEQAQLQ